MTDTPMPVKLSEADDDLQQCEQCLKSVRIEDCTMMEDCWFCPDCVEEWKAHFAACDHEWEPAFSHMGEPSQYCKKCSGIVANEDMPNIGPALIGPERYRARVKIAAYKSCHSVSPGNELAVAEGIEEAFRLLREFADVKTIGGGLLTGHSANQSAEAAALLSRIGVKP